MPVGLVTPKAIIADLAPRVENIISSCSLSVADTKPSLVNGKVRFPQVLVDFHASVLI